MDAQRRPIGASPRELPRSLLATKPFPREERTKPPPLTSRARQQTKKKAPRDSDHFSLPNTPSLSPYRKSEREKKILTGRDGAFARDDDANDARTIKPRVRTEQNALRANIIQKKTKRRRRTSESASLFMFVRERILWRFVCVFSL